MLLCINYAAENKRDLRKRTFRPWQQMNTQAAYLFGADKVREYSPKDIPQDFYEKNKFILDQPYIAGCGLWKPYITKDALANVDFGDYVLYLDTGAFYIADINLMINAMKNANTDVMCFEIGPWCVEKWYTKRDAFILMDCDTEKYTDTFQRWTNAFFVKKTPETVALMDEYVTYMQDPRIATRTPNELGKEDYEGFKRNAEDQTVWSLLTKKHDIPPFRSLSTNSRQAKGISKEVLDRSTYPTMICHHRCNLRQNRMVPLIPQIISIMKRIENDKDLIPKEFQYGLPQMVKESLADLIALFIDLTTENPITYLPTPQEILERCKELDMPETPLLKEALSKLSTPPKQASDKKEPAVTKAAVKPPSSINDYSIPKLTKNPSLEDTFFKLSTRQDLTTSLYR